MTASSLETDEEDLRDAIRQQVFERAAERWNRIHSRGFLGAWYGSRRLKAILVVEVDDGNAKRMRCGGEVIGAWCQNHEGLQAINSEALTPGPVHGHIWWGSIWEKQIWKFYISPSNGSVVLEEEDGPGSVWASRHSVAEWDGRASLEFQRGRMRVNDAPKTWWNTAAAICREAVGLLLAVGILLGITLVLLVIKTMMTH